MAGAAEGGSLFCGSHPLIPLWTRRNPLRLTGGSSPSRLRRGMGLVGEGLVEVVLLALSLERACQFVKAFGERGGNLHVT